MRFLKVLIVFVSLITTAPLIASSLSFSNGANPFVPFDVLDQFSKASSEQKSKFCVGKTDWLHSQLLELSSQPPTKIEGYNSRMDNRDRVIGANQLDNFVLRMSEAYTSAWSSSNEADKEKILDYLASWAEAKALLETYNCTAKGFYDGLGECAEWRQEDGQDLSKAKDFGTVQISVMHLAYGYHLLMSDFKPEDAMHQVIQEWFEQFFKRNPIKTDVYFGMDLGWHWPNIVYGRITDAGQFNKNNPEKLLKRAVKKLDSLINADGSLVNRTTRGNRALWYHLTGLNETLITFEMARAAGIEISTDLDARIQKAGEIFIRGFEDHSYMDQWAKEAYNSIYVPGEQIFEGGFDTPNGNAAMFIFMYRYPESEAAKKIAGYLSKTPKAGRMDSYIGFGMGCFYATAMELRDGPWSQGVAISVIEEIRSLQLKGSYPTGSYSEKNYKDVKFTAVDVAVEGTKIALPLLRFNLMFDFEDSSQSKPILVRIAVEIDEFPDRLESDALDKCNKTTFSKDALGLSQIRLALGEHADYKNECLLSSLSEANRSLILGLEKSLPSIIASSTNTEFGRQAAALMDAYSTN